MAWVAESGAWAVEQFGPARLGDARRTRRLVGYAARAAASPSGSVPGQCGCWKDTKGAYRLFDNGATTFEAVTAPHLALTRSEAARRAAAGRVVLHVSDTTTLSFGHPRTRGLGPVGAGGGGRGLLLHGTLALDAGGGPDSPPEVLGLTHQRLWARGAGGGRPVPESAKWPGAVRAVGPAPAGAAYVHVGDAEADCWQLLAACGAAGVGHVTRACQDRLVSPGHGPTPPGGPAAKLFGLARASPPLGGRVLWARARGNEEAGPLRLLVSAAAVRVHPPKNGKGPRPAPLERWAVRVWEAEPPRGREPVEWVLLTDRRVEDLGSALLVAFWYSCRWLIEEYHKCLKSGCRVEARQLEDAGRLAPLVGVLGVVAVRLLQLKHRARTDPDAPARSVVPERSVKTLAAKLALPEGMTARQFWRGTAQLGGFLGRKGDGDPGWQTLWRGWQQLELLTEGAELAKRMRP